MGHLLQLLLFTRRPMYPVTAIGVNFHYLTWSTPIAQNTFFVKHRNTCYRMPYQYENIVRTKSKKPILLTIERDRRIYRAWHMPIINMYLKTVHTTAVHVICMNAVIAVGCCCCVIQCGGIH